MNNNKQLRWQSVGLKSPPYNVAQKEKDPRFTQPDDFRK